MSDNWLDLPVELRERWEALVDLEKLAALKDAVATGRPTTFRINTLKSTADEVVPLLDAAGFKVEKVDWYPDAYIVREGQLGDLTELPLYKEGKIYVQSLSSMIPPLVLNPQPGEQVLDLTAAPGSKTTQMAALMNNQGTIIANDLSRVRLFKLLANLEQQGVTIVQKTQRPGEMLWQHLAPVFDKVLVDVPCSMEGRIRLDRPKSYADWSLRKIKQLAGRQKALLYSAIALTKPGGRIVYSTCTLAPEENEAIIEWALKKLSHLVSVETVTVNGVPFQPAVTTWQEKAFSSEVGQTKRIAPAADYEGFFIASLRRTETPFRLH